MKYVREEYDWCQEVLSFNNKRIKVRLPDYLIEFAESQIKEYLKNTDITKDEWLDVGNYTMSVDRLNEEIEAYKKRGFNVTGVNYIDENWHLRHVVKRTEEDIRKNVKDMITQHKIKFAREYEIAVRTLISCKECREEFANYSRETKLEKITK